MIRIDHYDRYIYSLIKWNINWNPKMCTFEKRKKYWNLNDTVTNKYGLLNSFLIFWTSDEGHEAVVFNGRVSEITRLYWKQQTCTKPANKQEYPYLFPMVSKKTSSINYPLPLFPRENFLDSASCMRLQTHTKVSLLVG